MPKRLSARALIDADAEVHLARHTAASLSRRLHAHDFYELFFLRAGQTQHDVNGEQTTLEAGDLAFIRPHDAHRFRPPKEDALDAFNLAFPRATFEALRAFIGPGYDFARLTRPPLPPTRRLPPAERATLTERLEALAAHLPDDKARVRSDLRAALADGLTRYFLTPMPDDPLADAPPWLHALCTQMQREEHFTQGAARMHALAPVTPEHLCRTTQRYLDQTPTDYANTLRLRHAAHRLRQTEDTVASVALACGFDNLGHFYQLFRARFGAPPGAWRHDAPEAHAADA